MKGDRRPRAEESPLSMSKAAERGPRGLAMKQKRHSLTLWNDRLGRDIGEEFDETNTPAGAIPSNRIDLLGSGR
jgi:hypothetical protein